MKKAQVFRRAILVVASFSVIGTLQGDAIIPPPTRNMVSGVWFGFEDGQVSFVRVEFDADGTGYIARTNVGEFSPSVYFIERWTPKKDSIAIVMRPIDKDTYPMSIYRASWQDTAIEMEYGGRHWKETATLVREADFLSRASETKAKIDGYRTKRAAATVSKKRNDHPNQRPQPPANAGPRN